jgi:tetratricopeptide (TPR) repeat protein
VVAAETRPVVRKMPVRWGRVAAWLAALAVSGSLVYFSLHRWGAVRDREQGLLSVPPVNVVKTLSAGYHNMLADLFYMQFTTYWGYWLTHGRKFHNVYPLLELVTELDPHFKSAYEVGALALADQEKVEKAVDLLMKGAHFHPDDYWYPYQAGMIVFLHSDRFVLAGKYFEMASRIKGAPLDAEYLAARMLVEGGQKELARIRWLQIYLEALRARQQSRQEVASRSLKRFEIDNRCLDVMEVYANPPDLDSKQLAVFALKRCGIDILKVDPLN